MPRQAQLALGETAAAPATYRVPPSQLIRLLAAHATFDGSGAATSWIPALEVVSDSGQTAARGLAATVAAGGAAEVTFGPFLRPAPSGAGAGTLKSTRIIISDGTFTQSIPLSTYTKIAFDDAVINTLGFADLANHQIAIATAGYYLISGRVFYQPPVTFPAPAGDRAEMQIKIVRAATEHLIDNGLSALDNTNAVDWFVLIPPVVVKLEAGDTVFANAWSNLATIAGDSKVDGGTYAGLGESDAGATYLDVTGLG